ncbi:probable disease resistance protein At4g27220 [Gossypium hirsutum]|uniref:Probable disease resistance protein At4g27220 n=1 Tax=Gossypium hirsutum TaxID=3635 RepID=A0ABM3BJ51_GOSHI|nr:probable disease resistance protein At4g27220 [Gossypium hirsutum]
MGCGFCEAALSNTVGTLVVDCVVKPVGRQLDYVRRFQDNVEKLLKKKRELADARKRLQHEIEEAKNRLLLIEDDVHNLQSRADETLSDMGTLEEEIQLNKRCLNWCPNWSWRYQLSKKAMKKIQELLDKFGELGPVDYRDLTALPTIDFLCSKEFVVLESSKAAFNQIIEALKDENINMIGLWGMGGVGKTTLAREVGSQAQKLNLFDKVVITVVSQNPKFETIKNEIAQYIRFDMKNEQGRRSEQDLWLRLKNEPRILIILDDIWESINLKKIGIPIGDDHKGCKVLLTTRRQQVCRAMDCQNVVQLGCLDDDEAWTLFEKKAGLDDFSDDSIRTPAKKIVKKCGGLPIAIVPLASALKGKTHHEWQAAYRRLKDRRLTEIEDVEENAYVCLEASFDYLKNMETKTCFLLCSLFPEDDEIYVENLVGYAWGLELYKGMDSIKDVRSEVLASIEALKNSGLLLDCGERHVKIHDVVRQFALWIASSRKEISFGTVETLPMDESFKYYTAISFETDQTDELPKEVGFPYLKLLLHGGNRLTETSSEFFEGMKALQVCALNYRLISLAAFKFNMNLRTLCLIDCELSDISMLGKLKSLHILSLSRSDVTELPTEAGDLENLRRLDLSYCYNLRRIAPNLIQRLSNLEELYLHGCSSLKWATENSTKKESYSSLSELNSLPEWIVISLDISSKHLPDGFVFRRFWSFDFCIGIRRESWYEKRHLEICPISRSLRIGKSVDACKQLFEDVESLELGDVKGHPNLIPSLDLGFSKLTSLDLRWCNSMQCLIDASKQQVPITAFSNLRKLSLSRMFDLEEMCNVPQPQGFLQKLEEVKVEGCYNMQVLFPIVEFRGIEQEGPSHHLSLQSLKIVEIEGCVNLKYIFPMSVANSLGQLHTLKIKSCSQLEDIIQDRPLAYKCLLQSLRDVSLIDLPQLKGRDVNDIMFTQSSLQKLKVHNCPCISTRRESWYEKRDLETCSISRSLRIDKSEDACKQLFEDVESLELDNVEGHPKLIPSLDLGFSKLTSLDLGCYHSKQCLIDASKQQVPIIAFSNLRKLSLSDMFDLEEMCNVPQLQGFLQKLEEVKVESCYNMQVLFPIVELRSIEQEGHSRHLSLQNLKIVEIEGCDNLKYIFPMSVANSLGQLHSLKIKSCSQLEDIIQDRPVAYKCLLQSLRDVCVSHCNNLTSVFLIVLWSKIGKFDYAFHFRFH